MKKQQIIKKAAKFVKSRLSSESSGHGWWHTWRVWQMAKKIAKKEKANLFIVEIAALFHDVADWKFQSEHDDSIGALIAKEWLEKFDIDSKIISQICNIIKNVSFKGAKVKDKLKTIEGKVVQDADRLDAMGTMGIARTFAYGGSSGREIYNPNKKPKKHKTFEEYKASKSPSINHFYEKLLLLRNRMNTKTGRKIAEKRHKFLKIYLKEFFNEWEGKS